MNYLKEYLKKMMKVVSLSRKEEDRKRSLGGQTMKKRVLAWMLIFVFVLSPIFPIQSTVQAATVTKNFEYTGEVQAFVAMESGSYTFEVWGAQGGSSSSYTGGKGGYAKGTITLEAGTILHIYVGGKGTDTGTTSGIKAGGFNGGGNGAISSYNGYTTYAGAGGGASDIRIGEDSLYSRVIVAGGGSGAPQTTNGYVAGGLTSGGYSTIYQATQTKAGGNGSFGKGGSVGSASYSFVAPGGGGGWYGGAGGYMDDDDSSIRPCAGGGSGYVYTSSTASNYPAGKLLTTAHYLTDTQNLGGGDSFTSPSGTTETGHAGNGYVRITYNETGNTFFTGDTVKTFDYTGGAQLFIVPETGSYSLEVWGAEGGKSNTNLGGKGGYSRGTINLTKGEILYVTVGGKGTDTGTTGGILAGGFNGGGDGAVSSYNGYTTYAGAGGGASDIRIGENSLYARVIVAGGGSGGAQGYNGYNGGGEKAGAYSDIYRATQIKAGGNGSFGKGASVGSASYSFVAPGGGGGWYGGAGGYMDDDDSSIRPCAGGGSGYVYTSGTASNYPSGCLLNSSYYMTEAYTVYGITQVITPNGTTEQGHSGNGCARITYNKTSESSEPTKTTTNFNYTGAVQNYTVPKTGKYLLEVWGAEGGKNSSYAGGKGGYSRGIVTLDAGKILYIYVGGKGTDAGTTRGILSGGFNGGGDGAVSYYNGIGTYAGAGGGASDIRIGQDSLYARVIVAGGGSGAPYSRIGYHGGGATGEAYSDIYRATQTKAGGNGSFGKGASVGSESYSYVAPGGGGGWYGGAGGYMDDNDSSIRPCAGGGSGYIYTSSTASNYPSGCLLNSSYYLTEAYTFGGGESDGTNSGRTGNGLVKISYLEYLETPEMTTSKTSLSIAYGSNGSFTYTYTGDGTPTVIISNGAIATVTINTSTRTVSVVSKQAGSATITVSAPETETYEEISKDVALTVTKISPNLTITKTSTTVIVDEPETISYSHNGNGVATASSSSTSTAKVSANTTNKNVTITGVNDGDAVITITVPESTNHTAQSATITVTVISDVTPPTIAFGTNGSSGYVVKAVTVVNVTDDKTGVDNSSLKYVWTQSTTQPSDSAFVHTLVNGSTISLENENGTWYLWVTASDAFGNKTATKSNAFNLDSTAPTGTMAIQKTSGNYVGSRTFTVNLTASDNISASSKIKVALVEGTSSGLSGTNSSLSWSDFAATKTINVSNTEGKKYVYVIFKDEVGNQTIYLSN